MKFIAKKDKYYNKEIFDKDRNNPVFVHFCGLNYERPWFNKDNHYRKIYEYYVELIGYDKDEIFKSIEFSLKNKLFYKAINNSLLKTLLKHYHDSILY